MSKRNSTASIDSQQRRSVSNGSKDSTDSQQRRSVPSAKFSSNGSKDSTDSQQRKSLSRSLSNVSKDAPGQRPKLKRLSSGVTSELANRVLGDDAGKRSDDSQPLSRSQQLIKEAKEDVASSVGSGCSKGKGKSKALDPKEQKARNVAIVRLVHKDLRAQAAQRAEDASTFGSKPYRLSTRDVFHAVLGATRRALQALKSLKERHGDAALESSDLANTLSYSMGNEGAWLELNQSVDEEVFKRSLHNVMERCGLSEDYSHLGCAYLYERFLEHAYPEMFDESGRPKKATETDEVDQAQKLGIDSTSPRSTTKETTKFHSELSNSSTKDLENSPRNSERAIENKGIDSASPRSTTKGTTKFHSELSNSSTKDLENSPRNSERAIDNKKIRKIQFMNLLPKVYSRLCEEQPKNKQPPDYGSESMKAAGRLVSVLHSLGAKKAWKACLYCQPKEELKVASNYTSKEGQTQEEKEASIQEQPEKCLDEAPSKTQEISAEEIKSKLGDLFASLGIDDASDDEEVVDDKINLKEPTIADDEGKAQEPIVTQPTMDEEPTIADDEGKAQEPIVTQPTMDEEPTTADDEGKAQEPIVTQPTMDEEPTIVDDEGKAQESMVTQPTMDEEPGEQVQASVPEGNADLVGERQKKYRALAEKVDNLTSKVVTLSTKAPADKGKAQEPMVTQQIMDNKANPAVVPETEANEEATAASGSTKSLASQPVPSQTKPALNNARTSQAMVANVKGSKRGRLSVDSSLSSSSKVQPIVSKRNTVDGSIVQFTEQSRELDLTSTSTPPGGQQVEASVPADKQVEASVPEGNADLVGERQKKYRALAEQVDNLTSKVVTLSTKAPADHLFWFGKPCYTMSPEEVEQERDKLEERRREMELKRKAWQDRRDMRKKEAGLIYRGQNIESSQSKQKAAQIESELMENEALHPEGAFWIAYDFIDEPEEIEQKVSKGPRPLPTIPCLLTPKSSKPFSSNAEIAKAQRCRELVAHCLEPMSKDEVQEMLVTLGLDRLRKQVVRHIAQTRTNGEALPGQLAATVDVDGSTLLQYVFPSASGLPRNGMTKTLRTLCDYAQSRQKSKPDSVDDDATEQCCSIPMDFPFASNDTACPPGTWFTQLKVPPWMQPMALQNPAKLVCGAKLGNLQHSLAQSLPWSSTLRQQEGANSLLPKSQGSLISGNIVHSSPWSLSYSSSRPGTGTGSPRPGTGTGSTRPGTGTGSSRPGTGTCSSQHRTSSKDKAYKAPWAISSKSKAGMRQSLRHSHQCAVEVADNLGMQFDAKENGPEHHWTNLRVKTA